MAVSGSGANVSYTIPNVNPGNYYLDIWKDNDNNGFWSIGDFVGWYGSGAWSAPTLTEFQISEGQTVNIDGYEVSWKLFMQAQKIDLISFKKQFRGGTLIIQIPKKKVNYQKNFEGLASLYAEGDLAMAIEDSFWKEIRVYYYKAPNLYQTTLGWLSEK